MQDIYQALLALNHLYCEASLDEYEQAQQALEKRIQQLFPGFTVAYAVEIGMVGTGEAAYHHGGVMHVLFPLEEKA